MPVAPALPARHRAWTSTICWFAARLLLWRARAIPPGRDSEVTNVTAAPAIAPLAHDGSPLVVSCFVYQNPAKSGSFIKPPELQMI